MLTFILLSSLIIFKTQAQLSGCGKQPCLNGATCVDQPNIVLGYNCVCPPGYSGLHCQISKLSQSDNGILSGAGSSNSQNTINKSTFFSSGHCLNGGTLISDGLPCKCLDGFTGPRCERTSSNKYCSSNPCVTGICFENNFGYRCDCPYGYSGNRCQFQKTSFNRRSTGISSFFSLLVMIGMISLCIYCCCYKPRAGGANVPIVFSRPGPVPNPYPAPMPGPFNAPRPYPGQFGGPNPMPAPGFNYPQQPVQNYPRQNQMPDPDEVFRVNQAPPSYEEVQNLKK